MNKPVIEVFGRNNCPWCDRAKELLEKRGYRFVYRLVTSDLLPEFTQRTKGAKTVPQIFVGSHHIGGFQELSAADADGRLQQLIGGM